ncbi:MAG: extracellular solute-binding protein [Chloroflexi bacterium]|nr:extracellular solute-binding protein [Chloroflexota bacterium]
MSEVSKAGISRRSFLRGLSVLGVGSVLAACAPAGAPAASSGNAGASKESVVIQHWVFWNQPGKVKDKFEASDDLKKALGDNKWEFRTGVAWDAGLTAVAGGTPPDIGVIGNYLKYMLKGSVIPLDDYISKSQVIAKDKFIEGNWNEVTLDGKVMGIPGYECFVRRGLNYNTRLIEEAGLDASKPPVTWDELLEWHKKLTKFDTAGNLLQFGIDPYDAEGGVGPGSDGFFLTDSWGFDYFDEEKKTFNLDNELMAKGIDVMNEFVKIIGPDNLAGFRKVEGQGSWGGSYNAEKQAMIIEGYWHPGETANEKPEVSKVNKATWIPVPEERRGKKVQFGGGHMAQIFKDAKNKDAAWPLAEWMQSQSFCDIIFDNIGWLPAYKPYFDKADPKKYPGLDFYFQSIKDADYWGKFIRCPIEDFISTKFIEIRESAYRGKMTGTEAAQALQKAAEDEWKNQGLS